MEFPTPGKRRKSTERCSYNCITSASSVRALTSHHSDSEFDIIRMYSCFMWTEHLLPFMWTERTQHNLKLEDLVSITGVNFPKSRNWELSICSPTERQGTSYEGLQIGNIPYILDTGRVGKKKKYICWVEEAIRAMESSANQLLGNLCLVPSKTFCENVLTNVKNKSFPFFFP